MTTKAFWICQNLIARKKVISIALQTSISSTHLAIQKGGFIVTVFYKHNINITKTKRSTRSNQNFSDLEYKPAADL